MEWRKDEPTDVLLKISRKFTLNGKNKVHFSKVITVRMDELNKVNQLNINIFDQYQISQV